jgi:SAM-dependent methyltransferase|tara:strand:+ start:2930 stop:3733 length:804 start_codon:yes stop_codon:yes gene_type:complete
MLPRKVINSHSDNLLKNEGNILNAITKLEKNKNLKFLLQKRYSFIKKYINENDKILELGAGPGLSKKFINNKNLKISDKANYNFLDYKNIDALNTNFEEKSFDVIFSTSLIHHLSNPIKLFNEVGRILKDNGRYIILDTNCSFFLKLIIILTKSECYDMDVNIYDKNINLTNPEDLFDSNNFVPKLIFNNFQRFNSKLDYNFNIKEKKFREFFIFLNSGGVIIDAPYVPLNIFFLKLVDKLDFILSFFSSIFPLYLYVCLEKQNKKG